MSIRVCVNFQRAADKSFNKMYINRRCDAFTLGVAVFSFMKFDVTALRRNSWINLAPISFAQNAERFHRERGGGEGCVQNEKSIGSTVTAPAYFNLHSDTGFDYRSRAHIRAYTYMIKLLPLILEMLVEIRRCISILESSSQYTLYRTLITLCLLMLY